MEKIQPYVLISTVKNDIMDNIMRELLSLIGIKKDIILPTWQREIFFDADPEDAINSIRYKAINFCANVEYGDESWTVHLLYQNRCAVPILLVEKDVKSLEEVSCLCQQSLDKLLPQRMTIESDVMEWIASEFFGKTIHDLLEKQKEKSGLSWSIRSLE